MHEKEYHHNARSVFAYIVDKNATVRKSVKFTRKSKDQLKEEAQPSSLAESEIDAFEALLDEESDAEFGPVEFKDRGDSTSSVKLAEWTARDFSSIYLRFRPHLERHARRFLRNPSQVDEVVQDAFLYLMVSLPELDSEIGVLRFLKWKTRLLALDVIRASGRAYLNSIDDVPEPESSDPEVSSHLERQDDAAVVKLALSKLNPRHREVLIASMYEEKSTYEISEQVGLSENATRQLVFRARAAFKKALIGDVDTTGMSAAAILSVATRKAAQEGKKLGASAMALVALVIMSITMWPAINGSKTELNIAEPSSGPSAPVEEVPAPLPSSSQLSTAPTTPKDTETADSEPSSTSAPTNTPANSSRRLSQEAIDAVFGTVESAGAVSKRGQEYVFSTSEGLTARFFFDGESLENKVGNLTIELVLDGQVFSIDYKGLQESVGQAPDGRTKYLLFADIGYLYDETGQRWVSSEVAEAHFSLELTLNAETGAGFSEALITVYK